MQTQLVFYVCAGWLVPILSGSIRISQFELAFLVDFAFFALWLQFRFSCPVSNYFQLPIQYVPKYFIPRTVFPVDTSETMLVLRYNCVSKLRCPVYLLVVLKYNRSRNMFFFGDLIFHSRWLRCFGFHLLLCVLLSGISLLKIFYFFSTALRGYSFTEFFKRSIAPVPVWVLGVQYSISMFFDLQYSIYSFEMNAPPLSDLIFSGIPYRLKFCVMKIITSYVSEVLQLFMVGCFRNLSAEISKWFYPFRFWSFSFSVESIWVFCLRSVNVLIYPL